MPLNMSHDPKLGRRSLQSDLNSVEDNSSPTKDNMFDSSSPSKEASKFPSKLPSKDRTSVYSSLGSVGR